MPYLAIAFPVFDPIAIAIGPVAIRWYALAYIGGIVLGWIYARALYDKVADNLGFIQYRKVL